MGRVAEKRRGKKRKSYKENEEKEGKEEGTSRTLEMDSSQLD